MIPAPEGAGIIRADLPNPLNSRSIFVLQKMAEMQNHLQKLVQNAVQMRVQKFVQKSHDADEYAANRADDFADSFPGSDNRDARNG